MKIWKRFLCLLLVVLGITGCGRSGEMSVAELPEGTYKIYYLNASKTKLVSENYAAESTDMAPLVEELMGQLTKAPAQLDCQSALTDAVKAVNYALDDVVLYLYFDKNYATMEPTQEILCRAALAKTLTQIDGVDYISISCDDKPLLDVAGNPVGLVSASDFVENLTDINTFEKVELTLYFSNAAGDQLVEEKREVVHNINTSMEKLIIEQLIAGPEEPGHYPSIAGDVKLLNISVNENVCYVNFDSSFLNSTLDVKDFIPIYSIVNSISGFSSVNKVQITVNGSQDVLYRDSIPLSDPFERNLDYIEGEKSH